MNEFKFSYLFASVEKVRKFLTAKPVLQVLVTKSFFAIKEGCVVRTIEIDTVRFGQLGSPLSLTVEAR